jgi:hypothetical protein
MAYALGQKVIPLGVGLGVGYGMYTLTKMQGENETNSVILRINRHHAGLPVVQSLVKVRNQCYSPPAHTHSLTHPVPLLT